MAEKAEEEDKKEEAAAEAPKKAKSLPIVTIILLVVYLAISGGTVGLLYKSMSAHKTVPTESTERKILIDKKDELEDLSRNLFPLETFFVNLKSPGGQDHLKMTIQLEMFDSSVEEELKKKIPIVRDIVVTHLVEMRKQDLQSVQDKLFLKTQLVNLINRQLKSGSVRSVYMTHFLIQ